METQSKHQETRKKATKYIIAAVAAPIAVVLIFSIVSIVKSQAKKKAEAEMSQYVEQAETYLKSLPESYWKIGYRVDSEIARVYYIGGNLNIEYPSPEELELHCFDLKNRTQTTVKSCKDGHLLVGYYFDKAIKYDTMIFIQSKWDDGGLLITALNTNDNTVSVLFEGSADPDDVIYTEHDIIINTSYETVYSSYYDVNEYDKKAIAYQIGTDVSAFYANVNATMKQLADEAVRRGKIAEERVKREEAKQQMAIKSQNNADNTLNELKRFDAEYKQARQEWSTTTDPMWRALKLQEMYYKNESCIAYAQKLGNQTLVNGYMERRRAIENLMRY